MKKIVKNTLLIMLIAVVIAAVIKLFIFEFFKVSGQSMEPTLKEGSYIYVNKLYYGLCMPFGDRLLLQWSSPKEGDIVIYLYHNRIIVKRCIATQGTPLEYSSDFGYNLIVKNKTYQLTEEQYHNIRHSNKVPEKTILVIGDNQSNSIDSRTYGFVPTKNILGRVMHK